MAKIQKTKIGPCELYFGDCLDVLKQLDAEIHACVTDPPYHLTSIVSRFSKTSQTDDNITGVNARRGANEFARLSRGFMGKEWDGGNIAQEPETWEAVSNILLPGAHLLAFGGTRTYHRMACAIEDAGLEIRDAIAWVYGSGFPKSHDISKAIDRMAGAEREVVDKREITGKLASMSALSATHPSGNKDNYWTGKILGDPVTEAAIQWEGWGTALKPAMEPICVARKPLSESTIAANVLKHGTGAINIDECRVELNGDYKCGANGRPSQTGLGDNYDPTKANKHSNIGRWPANLIHDGSEEVLTGFPESNSDGGTGLAPTNYKLSKNETGQRYYNFGDSGSAARFFYCAKASREERGEGNVHPTVKPLALMRYLVRLVTPPGGIVLDPFMGSGTTGLACVDEQFHFIGIEKDKENFDIACKRLEKRMEGTLDTFMEAYGI